MIDILIGLSPLTTLALWIAMMVVIYLADKRQRKKNYEAIMKDYPIAKRRHWQ